MRSPRLLLLAVSALLALLVPASVSAAVSADLPLAEPPTVKVLVRLHPLPAPAEVAREYAMLPGVRVGPVYAHALSGFAAELPEAALRRLQADPRVRDVAPDTLFHTTGTQQAPPWGLDRADQRELPLSGTYTESETGKGITVYVVDSGIRATHVDFEGRAVIGYDVYGGTGQDCTGHGTHVAGTAGGAVHGIAKEVRLVSVRTFDCYGSATSSKIVEALDWIVRNHDEGQRAVATMSFGGGPMPLVDDAVRAVIADGVVAVVAAGNESTDACTRSPARVLEALTVTATEERDMQPKFANYGPCVDLFAPGVAITSAYHLTDTATARMSGTSMAVPHVAGAAALHLQAHVHATPAEVSDAILANATKDTVIPLYLGTPNRLLYVGTRSDDGLLNVVPQS